MFYIIIIILLTFFDLLLKFIHLSKNKFIGLIINLNENFLYRIDIIIIFNYYLFSFNDIYLIIRIILSIPYVLLLINNFSINHLTEFMFSFRKYPYDSFSKIIDINLLLVKIFLSISSMVIQTFYPNFFLFYLYVFSFSFNFVSLIFFFIKVIF